MVRNGARSACSLVIVLVAVSLLHPRELAAQYIDPGSTSLLWQLLLSGLFGLGFVFRQRLGSLLSRFTRRRRKNAPDDTKGS